MLPSSNGSGCLPFQENIGVRIPLEVDLYIQLLSRSINRKYFNCNN